MKTPAMPPPPHAGASYDTPEGVSRPLCRAFPTLAFYWKVLRIVYGAYKDTKTGYTPEAWVEDSLGILHALEDCGISVHVEGLEHVADKSLGPCVIVANHMSTLETFVLPCLIQPHREVTFVAKKSLIEYPFFGPVLAARDPIIVGRVSPREDLEAMLKGGEERLAAGRSLIIFPQSTRSLRLEPENFNSIGVKLARRAKVPMIPLALRSDAWGMGRLLKDFGPVNNSLPVRFKFGEPVRVEGNGKAEQAALCSFISSNLEAWGLGPALPATAPERDKNAA